MPEKRPNEFEPLLRAAKRSEKALSDIGGEIPSDVTSYRNNSKKQKTAYVLIILRRYGITEEEYDVQMEEFKNHKDYGMCWKESNEYNLNRCLIEKLKLAIQGSRPEHKDYWKKFKSILEEINKKVGLQEQLDRMKTLINY